MAPLDPETREIQRRLREWTPFWAGGVYREDGEWVFPSGEDFCGVVKIVDKRKRLVPAIAHPWQLEFDDALEAQRAEGKPMRAIILKARKLGFSTWVALKFLQRLTQREYQVAVVTAQDNKTARVIFNMAKTAYSHLPEEDELGLGFNIKPALVGANFSLNSRSFMEFGEKSRDLRMKGRTGNSVFEIDTAKSPESGRGDTPSMWHGSEVARWEGDQATNKMIGQLNAVPYEPETIVVLESTANGYNHFQKRYTAARDGAGDPETGETYVAIFVPWWRDPRCSMGFTTEPERARFVESIGDTSGKLAEIAEDEPMLVEAFELTPEQLQWRRMMIRTQHEGSVPLFKQENPATDEEAFIGSGQTVFSSILVTKTIQGAQAAPAPVRGTLRATGYEEKRSRNGTVRVPTGAVWVPEADMKPGEPTLEVWEHPRVAVEGTPAPGFTMPTAASSEELLRAAAERAAAEQAAATSPKGPGAYVIAADIAEGEANTFTEGDYHAIGVFDHDSHEQVAIHESRMDKDLLTHWLLLIAIYYNRGVLAVEINSQGVAIVEPLVKDYRYQKLYKRERIDRKTSERQKLPGWKTDGATKFAMIETFARAMRESDQGVLVDLRTARQLTTFVYDEKGRPGAVYGEHDDRLMMTMIAHRVLETVRPPRPGSRRNLGPPGDPVTGYPPGRPEWD